MSAVLFSCECYEIGMSLRSYFHDETEKACYHEEEQKIIKRQKRGLELEGDTCVRVTKSFGVS